MLVVKQLSPTAMPDVPVPVCYRRRFLRSQGTWFVVGAVLRDVLCECEWAASACVSKRLPWQCVPYITPYPSPISKTTDARLAHPKCMSRTGTATNGWPNGEDSEEKRALNPRRPPYNATSGSSGMGGSLNIRHVTSSF